MGAGGKIGPLFAKGKSKKAGRKKNKKKTKKKKQKSMSNNSKIIKFHKNQCPLKT